MLHAAVSTIKNGPPWQDGPLAFACCGYFEVELPLLPELPLLLGELLLGELLDEPLLLGVLDEPLELEPDLLK